MMTQTDIDRIAAISSLLDSDDKRCRYQAWRNILHLYEEIVIRPGALEGPQQKEFDDLKKKAQRAFHALGGMAEPVLTSLRHYQHTVYGPYLGVSDEGGAAERIRDSFLKSPKALAYGKADPLVIGGAVDAERLGGSGEVPVGPDEYCDIQLACTGRVLTTTNVGTRVNARYYNDPPYLTIAHPKMTAAMGYAAAKAKVLLEPFWHTPGGKPVPTTLFISFTRSSTQSAQLAVLRKLKQEMQKGSLCDPSVHRLGLFVRPPQGSEALELVLRGLALAAEAGIGELAVNGVLRRSAQERISMPGLLNFFSKTDLNKLFAKAKEKRIVLRAWKSIDTDSVARVTWTSLQAARSAGLYLGKYGMLPLTLAEGDYVIERIQSWFQDWSAAPAIYIDCPTVAPYDCYDEKDAGESVRLWLNVAHRYGVSVVLIDTADKSKGRRLLKDATDDDVGILTEGEIRDLDNYARKLNIKALWAGGISAAQAYRFGKLGVFGIYTTTSTARKIAVSGDYAHDPSLPNEKEPTYRGVCRVAILLQAGFLQEKLKSRGDSVQANEIANAVKELLSLQPDRVSEEQERELQSRISKIMQKIWRVLLNESRVN
jgi:hypothetical protein